MSIFDMIEQMRPGMITSLEIFALTLIFTLPLGLLVAFGRMSRIWIIRYIIKIYVAIMRGTPLMLQTMVVFFGPHYLFDMDLSLEYRLYAVIIAFVLNYAAYFAEIYRAGIESMPVGQYEAAKVLGFNKVQTFVKIILPQVIKRIIPPVTNEIITLVKDTSLATVISCVEVFTIASRISASQTTMMPFVIAAVFYFIFNAIVAFIMGIIEKKLNYYTI